MSSPLCDRTSVMNNEGEWGIMNAGDCHQRALFEGKQINDALAASITAALNQPQENINENNQKPEGGDEEETFYRQHSLLSDKAILEHMSAGSVVIHPFIAENLSTSSYDVTLGPWFFRESDPEAGLGVYNPYSAQMVSRVWGKPKLAELASDWMARTGQKLENIHPHERIIFLKPGETILGHTNEFIGGRKTVTTMMKARSSMGRNFIEVCKCAGWGDIGYCSRWTMEITNNSRYYSIPLIVGRRIAQIVFFDSIGTVACRSYSDSGKYQSGEEMEKLIDQWSPMQMLPKMFLDREIVDGGVQDPLPNSSPYGKKNYSRALKELEMIDAKRLLEEGRGRARSEEENEGENNQRGTTTPISVRTKLINEINENMQDME